MRRQINAEELNILYASIGESIWHIQNLEDALHTCITIKRDIKKRGAMHSEQAEAILLKHRKNTLGNSLRISREAQVLSVELQNRLDKFKDERDWLVHRSVYQHREDLYEDKKRYTLMARIKMLSGEARALQKLVARELEDFVVAQGVSREWIENQAKQAISELKGVKP